MVTVEGPREPIITWKDERGVIHVSTLSYYERVVKSGGKETVLTKHPDSGTVKGKRGDYYVVERSVRPVAVDKIVLPSGQKIDLDSGKSEWYPLVWTKKKDGTWTLEGGDIYITSETQKGAEKTAGIIHTIRGGAKANYYWVKPQPEQPKPPAPQPPQTPEPSKAEQDMSKLLPPEWDKPPQVPPLYGVVERTTTAKGQALEETRKVFGLGLTAKVSEAVGTWLWQTIPGPSELPHSGDFIKDVIGGLAYAGKRIVVTAGTTAVAIPTYLIDAPFQVARGISQGDIVEATRPVWEPVVGLGYLVYTGATGFYDLGAGLGKAIRGDYEGAKESLQSSIDKLTFTEGAVVGIWAGGKVIGRTSTALKNTALRIQAKLSSSYIKEPGIKWVESFTIPKTREQLLATQGKKVTVVHMTDHEAWNEAIKKGGTILIGSTKDASKKRIAMDELHFFVSAPHEGKTVGYLAYVGIGKLESAKPKLVLFRQTPKALIFTDRVARIPKNIIEAGYKGDVKTVALYVGSQSGKLMIPTSNLVGASIEGQYVYPARFRGRFAEYPGTYVKLRPMGWTIYEQKPTPPAWLPKFLRPVYNVLAGSKLHKIELVEAKAFPVGEGIKIKPGTPTLDIIKYTSSYKPVRYITLSSLWSSTAPYGVIVSPSLIPPSSKGKTKLSSSYESLTKPSTFISYSEPKPITPEYIRYTPSKPRGSVSPTYVFPSPISYTPPYQPTEYSPVPPSYKPTTYSYAPLYTLKTSRPPKIRLRIPRMPKTLVKPRRVRIKQTFRYTPSVTALTLNLRTFVKSMKELERAFTGFEIRPIPIFTPGGGKKRRRGRRKK